MKYWLILYTFKNIKGSGNAIVIACNAKEAVEILYKYGLYAAMGYRIYSVDHFLPPEYISKCCDHHTVVSESAVSAENNDTLGKVVTDVNTLSKEGDEKFTLNVIYNDATVKSIDFVIPERILNAVKEVEDTNSQMHINLTGENGDTMKALPNIVHMLNNGRTYNYYNDDNHRNINNNLSPGIYQGCNLGRPADGNHLDETYTLIVKLEWNHNSQKYYILLWAYSENYPNRAFYRIVQATKTSENNETPNPTVWGDWIQISYESSVIDFVDELPDTGDINKIYIVPNEKGTKEIWVYEDNSWEKISGESITASGYLSGYTIGGLTEGTPIANKTALEILDMILLPEYAPMWISPHTDISILVGKGILEYTDTNYPRLDPDNLSNWISYSHNAAKAGTAEAVIGLPIYTITGDTSINYNQILIAVTVTDGSSKMNLNSNKKEVVTNKGTKTNQTASDLTTLLRNASENNNILFDNEDNKYYIKSLTTSDSVTINVVHPIFASTNNIDKKLNKQSLTTNKSNIEYTLRPNTDSSNYIKIAVRGNTISTILVPHPTLVGLWITYDSSYYTISDIYVKANPNLDFATYQSDTTDLTSVDGSSIYYEDLNNSLYVKYKLITITESDGNSKKVKITFT